MKRETLSYKYARISYTVSGTGPSIVLCFHGYGENSLSFGFLEKYAGSAFTFYAIDLPFHGQTEWPAGVDFTPDDLRQVIEKILPGQSADPAHQVRKISLLGFSLGGRVALGLYEQLPAAIASVVLLAPDGLKVNFWYWLATQSAWGHSLFAYTMKKPGWFMRLLNILNKLKLVNASIFKFVNYYIGDAIVRAELYARWTSLRRFRPALAHIKKSIRQYATRVHLLYGKYDRIILSSVGKRFRHGIEDHCTISIIHAGHQVLHEKHAKEILLALQH